MGLGQLIQLWCFPKSKVYLGKLCEKHIIYQVKFDKEIKEYTTD